MRKEITFLLLFLFTVQLLYAQQDSKETLPKSFVEKITSRATELRSKLAKSSRKILGRMERQELRLKRKLFQIDTDASNNIFEDPANRYSMLQFRLDSID